MAKNFFKRYIWLVDLLSRRGYNLLQEISDGWMKSPLNDRSLGFYIAAAMNELYKKK